MPKTCTIYYAVVVKSEGGRNGEMLMEPVKVEAQIPLGRNPDFCCPEFEAGFGNYTFHAWGPSSLPIRVTFQSPYGQPKINFCPFCGAEISLVKDLDITAKIYKRLTDAFLYEKA